jgi:hypothetical protein
MKKSLTLLFLFIPLLLKAELPPSAYEAMQAKAPELVQIEVLRVDVEPGEKENEQKVLVVAMVNEVKRTASGLKPNDIVNISYTIADHPKGWVGPGQVPVLAEKDKCPAFLIKSETGDYAPAAGRMSFSTF